MTSERPRSNNFTELITNLYICSSRFPGYIGPSIWCGWIAYSLVANPLIVYATIALGGKLHVPLSLIWDMIAAGTAISVVGMVVMGLTMEPSHHHTFHKHLSFRSLLEMEWDTRELTYMPDGSYTAGTDASRADLISSFTSDYWVSIGRLRAWLAKWDEWEVEQPAWFTDPDLDFQARVVDHVPEEALPPTVLRKLLAKAQHGAHANSEVSSSHPTLMGLRTLASTGSSFGELSVPDTSILASMLKKLRQERKVRKLKRRRKMAMAATNAYAIAIVISYVDLLGDVAVSLSLYQSETTRGASYTVIGIMVFSQVAQAILSFAVGHGPVAAFAALLGLKPLLNEYNALSDRPLTRGTKRDHEIAKTLTRVQLVVFQSLPQGFYQCLVLLQMAGRDETPSWVQWASVVSAALSVGFVVADTEYGVDTSAMLRVNWPTIHGYMPDNMRHALLVSLGTFLFVSGIVSSKWVAIATLATTSATFAGSWLVVECVVLLLLRNAVEGSWRFHLHGLDAVVPSVIAHLILYLGSIAAPFPFFRFPGYLGPYLYCASVCYQTIASPLVVLVAFCLDGGGRLPQSELWSLLAGATVLALLGASLVGCYMVPEYRKTFYKVTHLILKYHPPVASNLTPE